MTPAIRKCLGCCALFPYKEGLIDRYGISSPECNAAFNMILIKEYEFFGYDPMIHRLTIDSYFAQHPPHKEEQLKLNINKRLIDASIQSVGIHLVALYCILEQEIAPSEVGRIMNYVLSQGFVFKFFEYPKKLGPITVIDILQISDVHKYKTLVREWAYSVWLSWSVHHQMIKNVYQNLILQKNITFEKINQ